MQSRKEYRENKAENSAPFLSEFVSFPTTEQTILLKNTYWVQ